MRSSSDLQADAKLVGDRPRDLGVQHLPRGLVNVPDLRLKSRHIPIEGEFQKMNGVLPSVHHQPIGVRSVVHGQGQRGTGG